MLAVAVCVFFARVGLCVKAAGHVVVVRFGFSATEACRVWRWLAARLTRRLMPTCPTVARRIWGYRNRQRVATRSHSGPGRGLVIYRIGAEVAKTTGLLRLFGFDLWWGNASGVEILLCLKSFRHSLSNVLDMYFAPKGPHHI